MLNARPQSPGTDKGLHVALCVQVTRRTRGGGPSSRSPRDLQNDPQETSTLFPRGWRLGHGLRSVSRSAEMKTAGMKTRRKYLAPSRTIRQQIG